jgi:heme o synthase
MSFSTDIPQAGASSRSAATRARWLDYLELCKPRMNFLVLVTTAVGYYMAVRTPFQWPMLLHTLIGTALTAASAAAFNQLIEHRPDGRMIRTSDRPLPAGRISPVEALVFGSMLGISGVAYLAVGVNALTALIAALTLLLYIGVYTPLKRLTTLNTIIGAVPGALPFVMGWTAVRGEISAEALVLFGILFLWQMPHFLAIAIMYRDDYERGGFKMLPVVDRDLHFTGRQIVLYTVALLGVTIAPAALHMAGALYMVMAMLLGAAFLSFGISCAASRRRPDARKLFLASILYLPLLLLGMMIDKQ